MKHRVKICREPSFIDNYGPQAAPYKYLVYFGDATIEKDSLGAWGSEGLAFAVLPEEWERLSPIRIPIGGGPVNTTLTIT